MQEIKVAKLATCVKSAVENWGIKKYEIGLAVPSNDEQYIGSVLSWKKKVEGSLVTLHGAFDPNAGREIQTYLESQFAENSFTAVIRQWIYIYIYILIDFSASCLDYTK